MDFSSFVEIFVVNVSAEYVNSNAAILAFLSDEFIHLSQYVGKTVSGYRSIRTCVIT